METNDVLVGNPMRALKTAGGVIVGTKLAEATGLATTGEATTAVLTGKGVANLTVGSTVASAVVFTLAKSLLVFGVLEIGIGIGSSFHGIYAVIDEQFSDPFKEP